MKQLDEFALIRRLNEKKLRKQNDPDIIAGIGDDAAVVAVKDGMHLVACCDTMVETIHFNRWTMQPEHIGYKALASNVSDIAAMGGIPKYALVSISVPKTYSVKKLDKLYKGLHTCADRYNIHIIGGDTTSSPRQLVIAVTVFGEVERGKACLRSSAQPGQAIFVTGVPGQSAAGLHLLMKEKSVRRGKDNESYWDLIAAHQMPEPSVQAGRILLESDGCGALNDISDGLASELHEISEASGWQLVIDEATLPRSEQLEQYAASSGVNPLDWILFGGEDYHLVGTADRSKLEKIKALFTQHDIPFFVIGEVSGEKTTTSSVLLSTITNQIVSLEKKGYHHF